MVQRRGVSYQKRVEEVNRIYDEWARVGVPNREIWRRYIYPKYGISERTLYNMLNAGAEPQKQVPQEVRMLLLWPDQE